MHSPNSQKANPAGGPGFAEQQATGQSSRNVNAARTSALSQPSIELVLTRLEGVRPYGKGHTARCPSHEDRTASLSIAQGNDGRLLVHCFAGCSVHDIVGAIGLAVADLFPRRLSDASPEARKELQGLALKSQVKACASVLDHEAGVVLIAAGDVGRGRALADADHARLALAADRIRAARVAIGGRL